jgi:hypothetical protein
MRINIQMNNRVINSPMLFVGILFAGLCTSAHASVVQYTSQTSYLSASASLTHSTVDFEGIASSGQQVSESTAAGLTLDGIDFVGYSNANTPTYDLKVDNFPPNWSSGAFLDGPGFSTFANNSEIVATLPANIYSVGANLMTLGDLFSGNPSVIYNILLSTGPTVYTASTVPGYTSSVTFVGFVSTTPITSIAFIPQSTNRTALDNVDIGQGSSASPTPEAGTSLLCGSGLILMVRFLRRRTRSQQLSA